MRRLLAVALSGTVAAALLTGCGGRPAGVDGDLTDDWSAPPAPTSLSPRAGSCHPTAEPTSYLVSYSPRDCASAHRSETLHVGSFTGAPANAASPPAAASPARRAAFRDCDARATRFVGADWRGGSLGVRVVTPSPPGWTGGSRWYRCDVFEKPPLDSPLGISGNDLSVERVGSLRNALAKPSPLAYQCFNQGPGQTLAPVSCD
ncbi:MAG TPA: septum formation family protein, partial [Catenuloplanes sp.]